MHGNNHAPISTETLVDTTETQIQLASVFCVDQRHSIFSTKSQRRTEFSVFSLTDLVPEKQKWS